MPPPQGWGVTGGGGLLAPLPPQQSAGAWLRPPRSPQDGWLTLLVMPQLGEVK